MKYNQYPNLDFLEDLGLSLLVLAGCGVALGALAILSFTVTGIITWP